MDSIYFNTSILLQYFQTTIIYIFNLFPLLAYFLIHKKFKTIWTSIMFYFMLIATIVEYIRDLFMNSGSTSYTETWQTIDIIEPSRMYMYSSYFSGFLQSLSVVALLLFAINLHKNK